MADMFDEILDKCIDRINRGDKIEACLADYPEHADELKPLLESMLSTMDACSFQPEASARQRARQRFNAALREAEKGREKSRLPLPWILGRPRALAVLATVVAIALGGYFGIMQLISQETTPDVITATYNSEGNFAFFVSDAPNAIGDFQNLDLAISKIRLRQEDGNWVEFIPETDMVDLTQLQEEWAQQVWRGDVSEGEYTGAVLYVDVAGTSGRLKNSGETVKVGLNGETLSLDIYFEVITGTEANPTEFVYDVTVTETDGEYRLQPVPGESGTGMQIQHREMNGQT